MKFADPPSRSTTEYDWVEVAARLWSQHGKWLVLPDEKESVATAIRNGKIAALRGIDVATRNRHVDPNDGYLRVDIYLRQSKRGTN